MIDDDWINHVNLYEKWTCNLDTFKDNSSFESNLQFYKLSLSLFPSFILWLVGWLVWWMFFAARSRHQGGLADHAWNHAQTHHSSHIPAHETEANMLLATLGPIHTEHAIWTSGIPVSTSRRLLLLLLWHLACLCPSHVYCEIDEASVCLTGWMARPQSMRRHIPKYSFNGCNRHRG